MVNDYLREKGVYNVAAKFEYEDAFKIPSLHEHGVGSWGT